MNFIIAGLNISGIYTIYFSVLQCNAHVRPGRRRQHLILVTKAIVQLVFKKEKKNCCSNLQPWHKKSAALPTELRG